MIAINSETIDEVRRRCVIIHSTTPASLNITGADVDGISDDAILAAGSVLVTPDKNYIAFVDGTFTEKG